MGHSESEVKEVLATYSELLREIKERYQAIYFLSNGGSIPLHPVVQKDICYLQLRMICELIALGCLVVHRDIEGTKSGRIRKAYEADFIIKQLERLHPDFYPMPGKQIHHPDGRIEVTVVSEPYLTKADLLNLYAECGGVLHRGSIRNLGSTLNQAVSLDRAAEWGNKIRRLLNHHQIPLFGSTSQIWAMMQNDKTGTPSAFLMHLYMGPTPGSESAGLPVLTGQPPAA